MLGIADPCHGPTIISNHFECKYSIQFLDYICIEKMLNLKSLMKMYLSESNKDVDEFGLSYIISLIVQKLLPL